LAERLLSMTSVPAAAHVAVIGHHTLPFVLALMKHGCRCVRSLRPDVAAPDCEPADLAWIVDVRDERELDEALRAARRRAGRTARVVVEHATCQPCSALPAFRRRALKAGLDIVSIDQREGCLVLAPVTRLAVVT
jgi:hypothetical protein